MLAALCLPMAGGCSSGGDSKETEGEGRTTTARTSTVPRRDTVAQLGQAVALSGHSRGSEVKVTVARIIDPLRAGKFDKPASGKRYVGVEVLIVNSGRAVYADSPASGATLVTTRDEHADSTLVSGGACSGAFSAYTRIAPGARLRGCIPFEVRKRAKLKAFEFALESGYAEHGRWSLSQVPPATETPAGPARSGRSY
jgi:uncharacterized protein DUF4352